MPGSLKWERVTSLLLTNHSCTIVCRGRHVTFYVVCEFKLGYIWAGTQTLRRLAGMYLPIVTWSLDLDIFDIER